MLLRCRKIENALSKQVAKAGTTNGFLVKGNLALKATEEGSKAAKKITQAAATQQGPRSDSLTLAVQAVGPALLQDNRKRSSRTSRPSVKAIEGQEQEEQEKSKRKRRREIEKEMAERIAQGKRRKPDAEEKGKE